MIKSLRLCREVSHGGKIPRGWGLAWYEPRRRVGIYFPAPLHWLTRLVRGCIYRIRVALRGPGREGAQIFEMQREHQHRLRLSEEYANGYMAGWQECYAVCVEAMQEELARPGNIWEVGALLMDAPPDTKEN